MSVIVPPLTSPAQIGTPAYTNFTNALNSATARNAFVIRIPKSGTLDFFEWRTASVGNNPDNGVRMSFQGIDSVGKPDNAETHFAIMPGPFSTNQWEVPSNYMGTTGLGSGTKKSVTEGQYIACVLQLENFVASDSLNVALINGQNTGLTFNGQYEAGYTSSNSGTAWTIEGEGMVVALKYDDGTYAFARTYYAPYHSLTAPTYNTATNPDERGLVFQLPFPCRLKGFTIQYDANGVAHNFVLYDAADTVIETVTGLIYTGTTSAGYSYYEFATPRDIDKNVDYRLTLVPTTGSNVSLVEYVCNSQAIREVCDPGATWMGTTRNNGAGAWTPLLTTRPVISLVIDGFYDDVSGGGGEHSAVF